MTPTPRPAPWEFTHLHGENTPPCWAETEAFRRGRALTVELAEAHRVYKNLYQMTADVCEERDAALAERDQQIAWAREAQPRMLEMAERGKAQFEALEQARAEAEALRAALEMAEIASGVNRNCMKCNEVHAIVWSAMARLSPPAPAHGHKDAIDCEEAGCFAGVDKPAPGGRKE